MLVNAVPTFQIFQVACNLLRLLIHFDSMFPSSTTSSSTSLPYALESNWLLFLGIYWWWTFNWLIAVSCMTSRICTGDKNNVKCDWIDFSWCLYYLRSQMFQVAVIVNKIPFDSILCVIACLEIRCLHTFEFSYYFPSLNMWQYTLSWNLDAVNLVSTERWSQCSSTSNWFCISSFLFLYLDVAFWPKMSSTSLHLLDMDLFPSFMINLTRF